VLPALTRYLTASPTLNIGVPNSAERVVKLIVLFALIISSQGLNAQPWMENVKSGNPTFQEIQKSF
jgi:hypothetical protein